MRAHNFDKALCMAALSLFLCAGAGSAVANTGGGKGYPATPWRLEAPKDIKDIEKAKKTAAQYQTLTIPSSIVDKKAETGTDLVNLRRAALVAVPGRESDVPSYELSGSSLGRAVKVSFSQIESFSVKSKNDKTLTVSVIVWPDISAKDLLEWKGTYKQLREGYRREIVLEIGLKEPISGGRPLAFKNGWTIPLADLVVGTKVDFYGETPTLVHPLRFWWAVPSVATDDEYPFRIVPLR